MDSKSGFATGEGDGVEISTEGSTMGGKTYTLGIKDSNITKAASTSAVGYYFYRIIADASSNVDQPGKNKWFTTSSPDTARISMTGAQSEDSDYIRIILQLKVIT